MSSLDAEILAAVEAIPDVSVLVLFGSRARGAGRPDSDLDVAVLPAAGASDPRSRRLLQSRLAVALADLAYDGRVDVVFLDEADDVLRQRVMETGRVLVCDDPAAWRDLRVRTMREYGDREWVHELTREAQRRRLERGEPSGRSGRALASLERVGRLSR